MKPSERLVSATTEVKYVIVCKLGIMYTFLVYESDSRLEALYNLWSGSWWDHNVTAAQYAMRLSVLCACKQLNSRCRMEICHRFYQPYLAFTFTTSYPDLALPKILARGPSPTVQQQADWQTPWRCSTQTYHRLTLDRQTDRQTSWWSWQQ